MTGFFGKHSAKVDDKGRLVIPSGIKSVVPADQMEFVIRKDMYSNCLEMYTKQEWANMSQAVRWQTRNRVRISWNSFLM